MLSPRAVESHATPMFCCAVLRPPRPVLFLWPPGHGHSGNHRRATAQLSQGPGKGAPGGPRKAPALAGRKPRAVSELGRAKATACLAVTALGGQKPSMRTTVGDCAPNRQMPRRVRRKASRPLTEEPAEGAHGPALSGHGPSMRGRGQSCRGECPRPPRRGLLPPLRRIPPP